MLDFLVVGTGRCGTGFMYKLLEGAGITCEHERIFDPNVQDVCQSVLLSHHRAESSWLAVPHLKNDAVKFTKIIHIVREPMKTIASLARIPFSAKTAYSDYAVRYLPRLAECSTPAAKAAYMYVYWNKMIEASAQDHDYFFSRIEDVPTAELWNFLGLSVDAPCFDNKQYNSWPRAVLDINDIPCDLLEQLKKMSFDYGYDTLGGKR